MPSVADALRAFAPEYLKRFGDKVPIAHRKVLRVLSRCRTGELGNVVYECGSCGQQHWAGRSCGNRHCASCQFHKTQAWLTKQSARLLPVHYFCVTFTVPSELRMALRAHQADGYKALFDAAHEVLRDVGAKTRALKDCELGYFGMLHTWGRNPTVYHPHLHFVVPGGAIRLDENGQPAEWCATSETFLMHHATLIRVFRAKLRAKLKAAGVTDDVARAELSKAWKKKSVVDIKPVGNGQAVLKYLAPYVYRVAISDKRIVKVSDTHVTFTMTPSGTSQTIAKTVTGIEFVRGFLQHVLPSGFHKIRYYGPRRLGGGWRGQREGVEPRPRRVASVHRFDKCQWNQRLGAFRVPRSSTRHAIVRRDVAAAGWRVWRWGCFFCCGLCLANAPNLCPRCGVSIAAAN